MVLRCRFVDASLTEKGSRRRSLSYRSPSVRDLVARSCHSVLGLAMSFASNKNLTEKVLQLVVMDSWYLPLFDCIHRRKVACCPCRT